MRLALAVAVLGGLGSLCRWALSTAIKRWVEAAWGGAALGGTKPHGASAAAVAGGWVLPAGFPVWTFAVNALGSVAIGAVMGFFLSRAGGPSAEPSGTAVALTAGFLGGFTTYSAFAYETVRLLEQRSFAAAAFNALGTLVVCVAGCALGLLVGRAAGR